MSAPGGEQAAEPRGTVRRIARREVTERVRQRAFLLSTALTVLLVVGGVVLLRVLGGGSSSYTVGVVGSGGVGDVLEAAAEQAGIEVTLTPLAGPGPAREAVRDGTVDLALLDDRVVVVDAGLPDGLAPLVTLAVQRVAAERTLAEAGVDPATATLALAPAPPELDVLDPADPASGARQGVAFVAVFLLYGQLIGYGVQVANGVVEEKSTRVVELLLATVRPRQLLAGKVLGVGLVGLAQLLLVAASGVGAALALGAFTLDALVLGVVAQVLVWFLLGYTFYALLYAAGGSLVSRQEDLPNATNVLTFTVIGGFAAAVYASNVPEATAAQVLSFVPPFSALVMPIRFAAGEAAGGEVLAAMGLMVVAVLALLRAASRVYEHAVLRTGAPVRWRQALRRSP